MKFYVKTFAVFAIFFLSACSTLYPSFDEPEITITSFKITPSQSLPDIEIKLRIINPNSIDLELQGLSYSASIEGHKILSGVAKEPPSIPAYGEGEVTLSGSPDLYGSFQLLKELGRKGDTGINYTLNLKMDVGKFTPAIRIEKKGEFLSP